MLVLLIGRLLVEICLVLLKSGMIRNSARKKYLPGDFDENRVRWSQILQGLLAIPIEFFFMVYDIVEGRKFYKLKLCWCSQDFCKAVAVRVALAVSSRCMFFTLVVL